jgi:hypothetical protein
VSRVNRSYARDCFLIGNCFEYLEKTRTLVNSHYCRTFVHLIKEKNEFVFHIKKYIICFKLTLSYYFIINKKQSIELSSKYIFLYFLLEDTN